jgi:hypothetical protein
MFLIKPHPQKLRYADQAKVQQTEFLLKKYLPMEIEVYKKALKDGDSEIQEKILSRLNKHLKAI